jgi:hypothetical protein
VFWNFHCMIAEYISTTMIPDKPARIILYNVSKGF